MKSVLVTGASGLLGIQLVKKFAQSNYQVTALGRHECPAEIDLYCSWHQTDITKAELPELNPEILIHAAPLWLLPQFFSRLSTHARVKRCIAFSSTSAESKIEATDAEDQQLAAKLLAAESELKKMFESTVDYTIFRPTMIYGYARDANISTIAKFIKKYGFFPVAGKANGLRQPVHVDDLVKATVDVIDNKVTCSKIYNLIGGETLSYHSMVTRIFQGLNRPTRIIHLPVFLYRILLKLKKSGYSSGTADRMNQNLSYDSDAAVNDFNYHAQNFLTDPNRDLPKI